MAIVLLLAVFSVTPRMLTPFFGLLDSPFNHIYTKISKSHIEDNDSQYISQKAPDNKRQLSIVVTVHWAPELRIDLLL